MKDFVAINFSEYFKYIRVRGKQSFRKVAKSLYFFLTTPNKVRKYMQSNSSDSCTNHYNVEILNVLIHNYN